MTRFWMTIEQGVRFVLRSIEIMAGGEVFIPKIPSMRIFDLARAMAPECEIQEVGIRPGEKVHEVLLSEDEARHTVEMEDHYVITPMHPWWKDQPIPLGAPLADGFRYASDTNKEWLTVDQLLGFVSGAAESITA
jgi:UDP-N-acetylglucosamine 4,6-dehydratase